MNIKKILKKLKKIFYKIKWWIKLDAKYTHKHLIQGVKNLWRWFPTIWRDRDWDSDFIWALLEKKLTHQAEYIGRKGIHLNATVDSERMMTCVRLIKRLREDFYHTEYMDYHKSVYYWDEIPDRPTHKQLRVEEISENYDDYFKKYPLVYKKVVNDLEEDQKKSKTIIAIRMSWENHRRAKRILFKLMEFHIESWWD